MKKKFKITALSAILLILAIGLTSCEEKEKPFTLKGTKWKLVGIVDTETGNLEVLEPKDCEECYTLTFKTNYVVEARSINLTREYDLWQRLNRPEPMLYLCDSGMLYEIYDVDGNRYYDVKDFFCGIHGTNSYTTTHKELKVTSDHLPCRYLLFKQIN
jgi:hypothetical protein